MIAAVANTKVFFNVVWVSGIFLIVLRLLYFFAVVINCRTMKRKKENDKLEIIDSIDSIVPIKKDKQ